MTQEDKKLLLKDLCEQLPYGVKAKTTLNSWNNTAIKKKMKTFNQLNINDVLYILTECDDLYICKVTNIIESYCMKRIIYDYANKYTNKITSRYVDIPASAFDDTSFMDVDKPYIFELYLNKNEVLEDIDKHIDILMKHKNTLNDLYK